MKSRSSALSILYTPPVPAQLLKLKLGSDLSKPMKLRRKKVGNVRAERLRHVILAIKGTL